MIEVRLAKLDEVKTIVELCEEVKKTYSLWDEEYPTLEFFMDSLNGPGLYVLLLDGKIIGSISLEESIEEGCISLSRFFIVPRYQKNGYGKYLIMEVIEKLRGKYDSVDLFVDSRHPFALKMYQSFGFKDLGEWSVEWITDDIYHRLILKLN